MLSCIKPQYILTVVLDCILAGSHAATVVSANLCVSCSTLGGTDVLILDVDSCGVEALVVSCIVASCRAEDNEEPVVLCRKHGEGDLISKNEWSDIESCSRCLWNPVDVFLDDSPYSCCKESLRKLRDTHSLTCACHSLCIHIWSEDLD